MRRLYTHTFISLDGVMQGPGGPEEDPTGGFTLGGWTVPYFDDVAGEWLDRTFSEPFDLLLGRRTYDIFAAYWPHHTDSPTGVALNQAHKYVASQTLTNPTWEGTTILAGDAMGQVAVLKRQDGPPLNVTGSGNLIQSLLAADLIDEFRIMIFPLILGTGKRLFAEGAIPAALRLTRHAVSDSGIIMANFERSGPIVPGMFADQEPSEAELERRRTLGD